MSWTEEVRNRVKKGNTYDMSRIGKVKVVGNINQFGSNGMMYVKCEVLESKNSNYKVGVFYELNAEFMF